MQRTRDAEGATIAVIADGANIETLVTETPEHREGVFSGDGFTYFMRCSCGETAGPFDNASEARAHSDTHVAKASSIEEALAKYAAIDEQVQAEAVARDQAKADAVKAGAVDVVEAVPETP